MRAWERVVPTICSGNERGRQLGAAFIYLLNALSIALLCHRKGRSWARRPYVHLLPSNRWQTFSAGIDCRLPLRRNVRDLNLVVSVKVLLRLHLGRLDCPGTIEVGTRDRKAT